MLRVGVPFFRLWPLLAAVATAHGAGLPSDLIGDLGDDQFRVRENAQRKLLDWSRRQPVAAMPALLKETRTTGDPEVRVRCLAVLREIVLDDYRKEGPGYIGIAMRDDVAMVPGDPQQRSAIRVTLVQQETPGERAGLRADDLIVGIDREKWHDPGATVRFRDRIAATKPGTTVNLKLFRDGVVLDIPVVLCRRPAGVNQQLFPGGGGEAARAERDEQDAYFKAWMEERSTPGKMP